MENYVGISKEQKVSAKVILCHLTFLSSPWKCSPKCLMQDIELGTLGFIQRWLILR
uniref:Uncharacterized protein n=1 Tax=Brassica oleracea var. oleracea TaxID=109376 RepID=A0A0D2ZVP9_BRAOL